ncbi:MAG: class I SAM-dependent methyltransferase [Actinomycetota bacterium]
MSGVFRVGGEEYDDFMGRYSNQLAIPFADFAGVRPGERVVDVGAGTGALTRELLARGIDVVAVEPSPEFVETLRQRHPDIDTHLAPAEQLPFEDGTFDHALAQLVVAFMTDAPAAMRELARVARSVAICMWGVEEFELFSAINRAATTIHAERSEPGAWRYRTQDELVGLLQPFGEVTTGVIDITASYGSFDELWRTLEHQVGPAGAWLAKLDDAGRDRARTEIRRELGSPDGPFALTGRCYAARVSTDARSAPVPTSVT